MKNMIVSLVVCAVTAGMLVADEVAFRFKRTIDLVSAREDLAEITLDEDIFAETHDGFPDLRILDQDGTEVPFLLEKQQRSIATYVDDGIGTEVLSLKEQPDNSIEVSVRLVQEENRPKVPTWLELLTPLRNYEKRISVWGVTAQGESSLLAEQLPVFDYSRYMDVRNNRIDLVSMEKCFPLYRVVVGDVTDVKTSALVQLTRSARHGATNSEMIRTVLRRREFRIDRLRFGRSARREGPPVPVQVSRTIRLLSAVVNDKAKSTEILLATDRQPLTGFRFITASRNFVRDMEVEVEQTEQVSSPWHSIGNGTIRDISFRNVQQQHKEVSFPETRAGTYRVTIQNQDSPPLEITSVEGVGPVYRAILLVSPGSMYHMIYGSKIAEPPHYDRGVLETLRREKGREMVPAGLGKAEPTGDSGSRFRFQDILENPVAMGIAVLLALVVLGAGMVKALRGVATLSPEDDDIPPPETP